MKKIVYFSLFAFIMLFHSYSAQASHVYYGNINWECLNNGKYVFHLEVMVPCGGVYTYSNHQLSVGGNPLPTNSNNITVNQIVVKPDSAKWLANNSGVMSPDCGSATSNGNIDCSNVAWLKYYFKSDPIYLNGTPPSSGWTFSWTASCCRPPANNLSGSSGAATAYAKMFENPISPNRCFDSSPRFIEPLSEPFHCNGELNINYGAIDRDSDSLVYHFEQLNVSYASGYSYNNPLPDSNINSANRRAFLNSNTGLLSAKVVNTGTYLINIRVDAWRNGTLIASVNRERWITLQNCPSLPNTNPNDMPIIFIGANSTNFYHLKVKAGDLVQFPIVLSDTNSTTSSTGLQHVKLLPEAALFASDFQDTAACPSPPCATLTTPSPVYDSSEYRYSLSSVGAVGTNFKWETSCNHLNDSGETRKHYFYLMAKDDHCPLPAINHGVVEVEVEPLLVHGVQLSNGTLSSLDTVDQYQWYDCTNDTVIAGATASSYSPSHSGDYAVILQNGSCRDTSDCYSYTTVGLNEEHFQNEISFYPNPCNGLVNIELPQKQESLQIKVRNIHGQLVQEEQFVNQSNLQLQLNDKPGIYFIELVNEQGERANVKVVKR